MKSGWFSLFKTRRLVFAAVLVLLVGLLLETASWCMLRFLEQRPLGSAMFIVRRKQPEPLGLLIRKQMADPLFDRDLGWARSKPSRTKFPDGTEYTFLEDGSRLSGTQDGPAFAAFYGCSGTMGLEVGDSESFPAWFSQLTGKRVQNWGVPAYGPDQALLLFERKIRESSSQPPLVFLGMATEGVNRNMSAWRLFYTGENLLKPRLIEEKGELRPFNPILANPSAFFEASDREIIRALAPYDYWLASRMGGVLVAKPAVEFPFTFSISRAVFYLVGKYRSPLAFPDKPFQSPFNLHDQKGPLRLLEQITERFFERCCQAGAQGCLVLVADEFHTDASLGRLQSKTLLLKKGRPRKLDANFIAFLDQKGYPYVDSEPLFMRVANEEGNMKSLFRPYGHPTSRANRMIAEALVAWLQREKAVQR